MANDVPADYPSPNPQSVATGETLRSTRVAPMFRAANWLHAYGHARNVIAQCWPYSGGAHLLRRTNAAYPGSPVATWRIPALAGRSTVDVAVHCLGAVGAGRIVLATVNAADSVELTPGAALGWVTGTGLAVDAAGGYEIVELYVRGDGATATEIRSLGVRYPALASPLPTGALASGWRAFDADEMAADEGLSADAMAQLRTDLLDFRARKQVYFQWSGLTGIDAPPGGAPAADQEVMERRHARLWVPVHQGTTRDAMALDVHVRAKSPDGSDRQIVIYHGSRGRPGRGNRTVIDVPGAAALAWYTTTVQLDEGQALRDLPAGVQTSGLGLWPWPTNNALLPQQAGDIDDYTTADVYGVSIWGA